MEIHLLRALLQITGNILKLLPFINYLGMRFDKSHIASCSGQMGPKALMFSAPAIWKSLWKKLKLKKFMTLGELTVNSCEVHGK